MSAEVVEDAVDECGLCDEADHAHLASALREIVLPDIERVIDERVTALEVRQNTHFDAIDKRFDKLEDEYQAIKSGLKRLEERLDGVEQKLTTQDAQAELAALKARVDVLQGQIRQLEERPSA